MMHFHTIGNRCWCGHLTVPVRFHERDSRGNVIGNKGEGRYLAWLASDEKPDFVNPPVMAEINRDETPHVTKVCDETPNNVTVCDETPKTGRPKKYKSRAEQQAAYRRRHG